MSDSIWLILLLTLVTYGTRSSGYWLVSQFGKLSPRVLAALNAVPAAVLITIVIPPVLTGGIPERVALAVALLAAFRLSMISTLFIGVAVLALLRYVLQ